MNQSDVITIVSGLPRSGTSMMMSMLEAGGIPPVTDGIRTADEDNPKGYYEFERVKKVKEDKSWLPDARGKVVKMISQLLLDLPTEGYLYRVVFMRRKIEEILASQREMMKRRGTLKDGGPSDKEMGDMLLKHVDQVLRWVDKQPCMQLLEVDYNATLKNAAPHIAAINAFLGGNLDVAAMTAVVDKNLYRQRKD
ncbi:MAG: sulfotransferase family protein [Planctomycetota bacterium]|nr:MAG: sulfotransferase family protein [Planctomycetota bacterium]